MKTAKRKYKVIRKYTKKEKKKQLLEILKLIRNTSLVFFLIMVTMFSLRRDTRFK